VLEDIVIDTNVLVDASNPGSTRYEDALELLSHLLDLTASLRVDEGFSPEEATNRSRIVSEYFEHLAFGMFGMYFLTEMAIRERVLEAELTKDRSQKRALNQIIRNKSDRIFILTAMASASSVLTSHDYVDFQAAKRNTIRDRFGVEVVEANEAVQRL